MIIVPHPQGSEAWHLARSTIPTASNASSLIKADGSPASDGAVRTLAESLAGAKLAGGPLSTWSSADGERGHVLEEGAVIAYCAAKHRSDVERVGLCLADDETFGCSPDLLVGDDGLSEIKSQHADKHVHTIMMRIRERTPPPAHVPQCRMQLATTDRAWCDLMLYSWCPHLPSPIWRIERDERIEAVLRGQIRLCLEMRDETVEVLQRLIDGTDVQSLSQEAA